MRRERDITRWAVRAVLGLQMAAILVGGAVSGGAVQARELTVRERAEIGPEAPVPIAPQPMSEPMSEPVPEPPRFTEPAPTGATGGTTGGTMGSAPEPLDPALLAGHLPDEQALLASVPPGAARAALDHVLGMFHALFSGQGEQVAAMFSDPISVRGRPRHPDRLIAEAREKCCFYRMEDWPFAPVAALVEQPEHMMWGQLVSLSVIERRPPAHPGEPARLGARQEIISFMVERQPDQRWLITMMDKGR